MSKPDTTTAAVSSPVFPFLHQTAAIPSYRTSNHNVPINARLYCDPEGWDLRPLTSAQRDPRVFLQGELQRLEGRFQVCVYVCRKDGGMCVYVRLSAVASNHERRIHSRSIASLYHTH